MSTRCQIEFYDYDPIESEFSNPAARIYKHSDGYPEGILPMLKKLESACQKGFGIYGQRLDDPEWAAAEFISMFRPIGDGQIYVTQDLHPDIEYLYRVICNPRHWEISIFQPEHNSTYDIVGFHELNSKERI